MRTILVGLSSLVVVVGVGCGGGGDGDPDARRPADAASGDATVPDSGGDPDAAYAMIPEELPDPLPTGDPEVKVATVNAALALTIKYAEQRLPELVSAIDALDADVVCLQEVWDHLTNVEQFAGMLTNWPYAFYSHLRTTTWGSGVLILSKHPLYRGRQLRFEMNDSNGVIDRMIIGADVVTDESHFHVLCTHLEAYDVNIRNAEIAEIATWAEAEGYLDGAALLLGDFNTGPQTSPLTCDGACTSGTCNPQDQTGYDTLVGSWTDANDSWDQCTYCRDIATPLQVLGTDPCDPNARIDHVFYRNLGSSVPTARSVVLDQQITIDVPNEGSVTTNYSDHLGVVTTFAVP